MLVSLALAVAGGHRQQVVARRKIGRHIDDDPVRTGEDHVELTKGAEPDHNRTSEVEVLATNVQGVGLAWNEEDLADLQVPAGRRALDRAPRSY
jgi:hypothetical protein